MTRSGRTHVLLVSHEATRTGAPRIAVEIARVLTEHGDRVTTLLRWDGPLRRELATASTSLRLEPFRRVRAMVRRLRPRAHSTSRFEEAIAALTLRWIRPDLVYANTVKAACYVRPALRGVGVHEVRADPARCHPCAVRRTGYLRRSLS